MSVGEINSNQKPTKRERRVISEKGQTVIPKPFRDYLDARSGDQIEWDTNNFKEIKK
jgi:AbrB family looped-hinge helix DNA binding protein